MKISDIRALLDVIEEECGADVDVLIESPEYVSHEGDIVYFKNTVMENIVHVAAPDGSMVFLRGDNSGSDQSS